MNKKILNLARLAVLLAASSAGSSAFAVCDGCVVGAVQYAAGAVTQAIGLAATSINTGMASQVELRILPALAGVAQTVSQTTVDQTGHLMSSQTATQMTIEKIKLSNRYKVTDPCSVGAGTMVAGSEGMLAAAPTDGGGVRGGNPRAPRNVGSAIGRALAISEGKVEAPSPEVTARVGAAAGCDAFATGVRANACRLAGLSTNVTTGYANADVRSATLMDGPQKDGEPPRKKFSLDLEPNSQEELAIAAYRRNLGSPVELRSLTAGELKSDAGRRYLAVRDSFDSRMDLANRPGNRQQAGITSDKANIAYVKELTGSTIDAGFIASYLAKNKPNWSSMGISSDEKMNIEVERRYGNPEWIKATVKMSPEEIGREQLRLSALQNVLLWRLNQEVREGSMISGEMLASMTRTESLSDLKTAHAAATR